MDIQVATSVRARLGEGPVWDADSQRLHWVDILAGQIHTTDLANGATCSLTLPTMVGAVAPRRAGGLVAATAEGFAEISVDGVFSTRCQVLDDRSRMNDGKCDSRGRFWAGSTDRDFAPGRGVLHLLKPDWTAQVVLTGLTLPNGLGWSPDGSTFYLVDSLRHELLVFDFDVDGASLSGRRTLVRFDAADGLADGLCVDAEGCLWLTIWGRGQVRRMSPTGELMTVLAIPALQSSSCAFAGPDLDLLCVTSALDGLDAAQGDQDGALFVLRDVGARGSPMHPFAG